MPAPGDLIALDIEKPAAGGRMLARLDGQIVFVSGTIPGEHVTARVEFVRGGVVFARAQSVDVWSPDRRADGADRDCGGNDYAHILYGRQLTLKRDLVEDAFSRIAKLPLPADVRLHASPERGYRMRARLHVDAGQVGFYRQASHDLCDPMSSGQLHEGAANPLAGTDGLGTVPGRLRDGDGAVRDSEAAHRASSDHTSERPRWVTPRSSPDARSPGIPRPTCGSSGRRWSV